MKMNVLKNDGSNVFVRITSLNGIILFFATQAFGQGFQISTEWKAHFTNTPVIENCIFEHRLVDQKDQKKDLTRLFQFRWQTNAFLFRQIANVADAASNHIPAMLSVYYAGHFGRDSWSIEWAGDAYGTLCLLPDAGNIWDTPSTNAAKASLFIAQAELSTALDYGIGCINPDTLEWSDNTNFTALIANGFVTSRIVGNITGASNGLPTGLQWHIAGFPEGFSTEYEYDNQGFGLWYFPTEIRTYIKNFAKPGKQKRLVSVLKILDLKTSPTPLAEQFFDPKTYFVMPPTSRLAPAIIVYTNGQEFAMEKSGRLQEVLSAQPPGLGLRTTKVKGFRLFFLCSFVLPVIVFWLISRHIKQQQSKQ